MKLFVGLGNPGANYSSTRHNVGFMAVDYIGRENGAELRSKIKNSLVGVFKRDGEEIVLAKPQGYMNRSGIAVRGLMGHFSLKPEDITVVHDDVDIPLGKVKEKKTGGTGGHNGIASIIDEIGTRDFRRLRIGVGRPPKGVDTADYVLSPFGNDEKVLVTQSIEDCYQMIFNF